MQENRTERISEQEVHLQYEYIDRVRQFFSEKNSRPVCCTRTYGCQQNENDSERLNGMLSAMGFVFTEDPAEADLILVNTCAIREHAEQKVFGVLGSFAGLKRKKTELLVAVCGCMAGQDSVVKELRQKYRQVSLVFNPHALYRFPQNLYRVLTENTRVFDVDSSVGNIAEGLPVRHSDGIRAWVSIMYGCNNFCSYCIVPYVRGRERSRLPQDILCEFRELVHAGYQDITLLGQNVNSYCNDLDLDYDFSDLLRDICAIPGDFRVKFMTSHPKDASRKLMDTIAAEKKICRHLHLPFQSGSNKVLKEMNRKYTREQYLELVAYAKKTIPDLSLTSDVIVGFPGETEEDFEETLDLVRQVGFSGLYTFLYSPRPGTPAAERKDQVDRQIKSARFERLLALQNLSSEGCNSSYLGKDVEVLVYGVSQTRPDLWEGRTDNDTLVQITPSGELYPGERMKVHIEKTLNWAIFGTKIEQRTETL